MIYIPSFIKIGPGIQKLIGGGHKESMEIAQVYFDIFRIRKVG
jgi:hypothetical protein